MARMVNAVIGKKNKTWCDNFMLAATLGCAAAHRSAFTWRDRAVRLNSPRVRRFLHFRRRGLFLREPPAPAQKRRRFNCLMGIRCRHRQKEQNLVGYFMLEATPPSAPSAHFAPIPGAIKHPYHYQGLFEIIQARNYILHYPGFITRSSQKG